MRILIIDDDIDTLTSMNFLFSINNYIVETEPLWQNTFNKIKLFKPDVILLDIHLRGEDGRNICRQIKSDPKSRHIYIILFSTSLAFQSDVEECFADDFIGKPFKINVLLERINYRFSKN
ncbi:MAG: response regulator [Ginsengibacter sp.]